MAAMIGYDEITRMMLAAVKKVRENHALLSKLDAATGDGDHGTAMLRCADAMEKGVQEGESGNMKTMLHGLGWGVMSIDAGSTGPLFGSFFMGLSEGVADASTLDTEALAKTFEAGQAKIQKQTKAQPGDKTLMDALVPAVLAMQKAANEGVEVHEALKLAAEAADAGAKATADMQAKFGRARNLGERTLGHIDPGATSVALLFQGFAEGVS